MAIDLPTKSKLELPTDFWTTPEDVGPYDPFESINFEGDEDTPWEKIMMPKIVDFLKQCTTREEFANATKVLEESFSQEYNDTQASFYELKLYKRIVFELLKRPALTQATQ
ncbi:MAG: hypothetical protein A2542_01490 [Parcubacteria group bacterium RIFOXYD2_FULL_52_8]|nr:MAG: hypothetical protein A2542_01490 [Parcubacteria group bacterium RIFOXYD2_FULL_52_8]